MPRGGGVPTEALSALRRRLMALPMRHPERSVLMASTAQLYAVSRPTLYRLLSGERRPKDAHRADRGRPRAMPAPEIERWCEIVAAMKIRTTNKKGRQPYQGEKPSRGRQGWAAHSRYSGVTRGSESPSG